MPGHKSRQTLESSVIVFINKIAMKASWLLVVSLLDFDIIKY